MLWNWLAPLILSWAGTRYLTRSYLMQKFVVPVVLGLLVSLVLVGTVMAITKEQATVLPVLETLKLERVKSKVIGGPQKFKVTKETLELLKDAMDKGHVIILENNGTITISPEDAGAGKQ